MSYDVAVIGAGPAGSSVARLTASRGLKTLLVEEHEKPGEPVHCAGKLTLRAFQEFDLPNDCILNSVKGAYLYSPSSVELAIRKRSAESHIIDRAILDRRLFEAACDAGACTQTAAKVYDVERRTARPLLLKLRLKEGKMEVRAQMVVDAEGSGARLTGKLGLQDCQSYLNGFQYEMAGIEFKDPKCVELHFGREFFPGFFGWIIPLNAERARVGLGVAAGAVQSPRWYLENALRRHPILSKRSKSAKIIKAYGGRIPLHGPIPQTYARCFLAVGDAAAQAKSTTGGGVYFGLKAAEIAGRTAAECLEEGRTDAASLSRYQTRWQCAFGKELKFTSRVRRILDELSDNGLDRIFNLISEDEKLVRELEKQGDTAYQSRVAIPLALGMGRLALHKPAELPFYLKLLFRALVEV